MLNMPSSVAKFFLVGCALALLFFLLRNSIDRRKGVIAEVAAVTLPLAIAALFFEIGFGVGLAQIVQIEFLVLPVFVMLRLYERLRQHEQLQLSDLFRITTVASLSVFAVTTFRITPAVLPCIVCLLVYVAAEWSSQSKAKERNLAMVFVAGFMVLIFASLFIGLRYVTGRTLSGPQFVDDSIYLGLAMVGLLLPPTLAPQVGVAVLRNFTWFHAFAVRVARWQQALGNPQDMIFVRTIFDLWQFRSGVCYLNHGSFGAVPVVLRNSQQKLRQACEQEPMDWLSRQLDPAWMDARFKLAIWLGTQPENIAFCENATAGMNEIAHWFPLRDEDEVLLNDHEYGAVKRIWERRCRQSKANLEFATLPLPLSDPQQITDAILERCSDKTRLVVLSHITSPTAIKLPVEQLCFRLRERGIATCIDGPHALLQEQLKLNRLQCDFYTASCHKWLCAPLGSGFIYVAPKWHSEFQPARLSWGRLQPNRPENWSQELMWTGTRDYSAYLSVPAAIDYFAKFDLEKLDQRNHALACYARRRLLEIPGTNPVTPEGRQWFGWMVGVWLPLTYASYPTLQKRLWEGHGIEVPIVKFGESYLIRVSTHIYNSTHDIDRLVRYLGRELSRA